MAIRNIVKDGDPILKKKCREITDYNEKLHTLLDDMKETLIDSNGLGLAGPQVGMLKRVCIVLEIQEDFEQDEDQDFDQEEYLEEEFDTEDLEEQDGIDGEFIEFINPVIISTEGSELSYEGCLSFPERNAAIERPTVATVRAFDRFGDEFEKTLYGINARCICHECNHLDGITILDLADHFYEDLVDQEKQ